MTWQRIDEDTYIDDSLVTCAEYQLFIDEMREQGKYYQPDHWTSYQFPDGQGLEPILGVRHSDATNFCEWLSTREEKRWRFRLPYQKEAFASPIKFLLINPLGYWVEDSRKFQWVGPSPEGARSNDFKSISRDKLESLLHDRKHPFSINILNALNSFRYRNIDPLLRHRQEYLSNSALDFDRYHNAKLGVTHNRKNPSWRRGDVLIDIDLVFDRPIEVEIALDSYLDLITLYERIVGHSSPFEGIRLIRERVR